MQWNLDVTRGQGTGKICSLHRGFVKSRWVFIHFAITSVKKIVRYIEVPLNSNCLGKPFTNIEIPAGEVGREGLVH